MQKQRRKQSKWIAWGHVNTTAYGSSAPHETSHRNTRESARRLPCVLILMYNDNEAVLWPAAMFK